MKRWDVVSEGEDVVSDAEDEVSGVEDVNRH